MSGPKHGEYINYRAEIEEEIRSSKNYIIELKKTLSNMEKLAILGEEEKRLVEKHGMQEWEAESNKIKSYVDDVKEKAVELEKNLQVRSYRFSTLRKVRETKERIKKLLDETKRKYTEFRKQKKNIVSLSKERAEEYKTKTEKELRETIEPNMPFLEEWSFDDRLSQLKEALENFKDVELENIEKEYENIINLYYELQSKAMENKKSFEIKKDTSSKIIDALVELNYTNIERTLEGGPLGKIIVKAEAPDGSWNVTYEVGNDGEIKTITPDDDRCHVNLGNINKKLKDYGVHVDIKELRERKEKEERKKDAEKQRRRR